MLNNDKRKGQTMEDVVERLLDRDLVMNVINADGVGCYACVPFTQGTLFTHNTTKYFVFPAFCSYNGKTILSLYYSMN